MDDAGLKSIQTVARKLEELVNNGEHHLNINPCQLNMLCKSKLIKCLKLDMNFLKTNNGKILF